MLLFFVGVGRCCYGTQWLMSAGQQGRKGLSGGGGGVSLQCELKMASLVCVVGQHEGASRVYHFSSCWTPRLDQFLLLSYGVQLQHSKNSDTLSACSLLGYFGVSKILILSVHAQCWVTSVFP